jgi:hypothetical protein
MSMRCADGIARFRGYRELGSCIALSSFFVLSEPPCRVVFLRPLPLRSVICQKDSRKIVEDIVESRPLIG